MLRHLQTKMMTTASNIDRWSVPNAWQGGKCFIVCGGPSVADHDLSKLNGHRVIVINSSFQALPNADYLIFADRRWWEKWRKEIERDFNGLVVALTPMGRGDHYVLLERKRMSGLYPNPTGVAMWHTTTTAAINLACHLLGWQGEIGFLGLDGGDRDGKSWHHEPHIWAQNPKRYEHHREALELVAKALPAGVRAYNCNPNAAHQMFPHKPFEEMAQ